MILREKINFDIPGYIVSITVFGIHIYDSYIRDGFGWLRLFGGVGLTWKHKSKPLLFSEKYGHNKSTLIFNYRFRILKNRLSQ